MIPKARLAAAIEVLDAVLAGDPPHRALSRWGREHRFAGGGDRRAIADHVYEALRCRASLAHLGGSLTGRGLVLGLVRARGTDPTLVFDGEEHAPATLTRAERDHAPPPPDRATGWDLPAWAARELEADFGAEADAIAHALRSRAPVFLRANRLKTTRADAIESLLAEGITARPHSIGADAIEVTAMARKISQSDAYVNGLVELQDAASQAVVEMIPTAGAARILDYCAGGGGKTLHLAARVPGAAIIAHDANPARMTDLPARAVRAGARIEIAGAPPDGPFDVVLCDVPCSGSGAWRRDPLGKWRLGAGDLAAITATQRGILRDASALVGANGRLAYSTCSLFAAENRRVAEAFVGNEPGWRIAADRQFTPLDGGDGFYCCIFTRAS